VIELKTGVPGSGKTLSAVHELAARIARWDKHPDEARPVFVHGVKGLKLPHAVLPVSAGARGVGSVPDWDAVPDGALILIDEAQDLFPPRSTQSQAPAHVAWLNTHRHRGIDMVVITQHPKLVDGALRALVGKHQHFRRLFGGGRSIVYEWDSCSDSLSGLKTAVTSHFGFPKAAFAHYHSAELHTKQSFRLPLWLVIPFIALAIGALTIPKAYSTIANGISGRSVSAAVPASAPLGGAERGLPVVPEGAASGAAGVSVAEPSPPRVAGCVSMGPKCLCIDRGGVALSVPEEVCRTNAVVLGQLIPYDTEHRVPTGAGPAASVPLLAPGRPSGI